LHDSGEFHKYRIRNEKDIRSSTYRNCQITDSKKLLFYMHTWKILKIYDYSRTKTAAILIYSF
jgi:hypothetical protein